MIVISVPLYLRFLAAKATLALALAVWSNKRVTSYKRQREELQPEANISKCLRGEKAISLLCFQFICKSANGFEPEPKDPIVWV